jgi:hypothetical protein
VFSFSEGARIMNQEQEQETFRISDLTFQISEGDGETFGERMKAEG